MPSLWKSGKIARLSGFVCDLRARRRGSSLLVETGFPTSLADLVVKNRTRLRKPLSSSSVISPPRSKSNGKKIRCGDCSPAADSSSSPCSLNSTSSDPLPVLEFPSNGVSARETEEEVFQYELSCSGSDDFKDASRGSVSRCFPLALQLFFVLAIALGTKEIALGITVFTFLLLLLESVGKHLSSSRPMIDRTAGLDLTQVDAIEANKSSLDSSGFQSPLPSQSAARIKIQIENIRYSNVCEGDVISPVQSDFDISEGKERLDCAVKERISENLSAVDDDRSLYNGKKSRDGSLRILVYKQKFSKKFLPKRFRSKKEIARDEELSSNSGTSKIELVAEDAEEEAKSVDGEEICSSSTRYNGSVNSEDMSLTRKDECRNRHWHWGYPVPIVIVLLGLIGGRSMALLLTVSCFLLVKSVLFVWRYFKKMHECRKRGFLCWCTNRPV